MSKAFVDSELKGIRDLAVALGHDPDAVPIRSITIRAVVGDVVTATIEQLVLVEQLGRVMDIVRRLELGENRKTREDEDWERFVEQTLRSEA